MSFNGNNLLLFFCSSFVVFMDERKNIITDDVLLFHPLLEGYDVDIVLVPSSCHLLHQVPLDGGCSVVRFSDFSRSGNPTRCSGAQWGRY